MEVKYLVAGVVFVCVFGMFIYAVGKFKLVVIDKPVKKLKLKSSCLPNNITHISVPENKRLKDLVRIFLESEDALARDSYEEYMLLKAKALKMSRDLSVKLQKTA